MFNKTRVYTWLFGVLLLYLYTRKIKKLQFLMTKIFNEAFFILIIFTFFFIYKVNSQNAQTNILEKRQFQKFDTKNGLPSNQVYNLFQDKSGTIWFATDRGISKYNGYEFTNFGVENGLTSNTVFNFYPQNDNSIWCSTLTNEVFCFNPKTNVFTPYQYNKELKKHAKDGDCNSVFIDKHKTVYLGFRNHYEFVSIDSSGVLRNKTYKKTHKSSFTYIIHYNNKKSFSYKSTLKDNHHFLKNKHVISNDFPSDFYFSNINTNGKTTLISSAKETYVVENGITIKKINIGKTPLNTGFIKDKFWVSYNNGGLVIYNYDGSINQSFLENKSVTSLFIDHEKNYWISTLHSGVFYSKNIDVKNILLDKQPNVISLSKSAKGNLITTLSNGKLFENIDNKFKLIKESASGNLLFHEYYTNLNKTLYASGSYLYTPEKKINLYVRKLPEDNGYKIKLPTTKGVYSFDGSLKNILQNYRMLDICTSKNKSLIATQNGLYEYKANYHKPILKNKFNLPVRDIDLFNKNTFLIASTGKGLGILNDHNLQILTTKDGLSSNIINEVYVQNDSTFWACTNAGLDRVNYKNKNYNITSFNIDNGLNDNNILDIEIIDNTLWVATNEGLNKLSLKYNHKDYPLNLNLKSIIVNDQTDVDLQNLNYNQNKIEVTYEAISFKKNKSLTYRYRIKDLDNQWSYTKNRSIIYESLPYGKYEFQLQAGFNNVFTSNKIQIPIIIHKPFFKEIWFILILFLAIVTLIYFVFKYRILKYNKEIVRELLRHLLKRINKKSSYFIVRESGKNVKINSLDVLYIKSLGNYIEIYTSKNKTVIREKISAFKKLVPDSLEYIQIHRSYIVRIDKISKKGSNSIIINDVELKVGKTFFETTKSILSKT